MMWKRLVFCAVLFAAAAIAMALWQRHEYHRERAAAQQILRREAESLTKAVVSGLRSHRRINPFFDEQAQGLLGALTTAEDVLAVAILSSDGKSLASAGRQSLIDDSTARAREQWRDEGVQFTSPFELDALPAGGPLGGQGLGSGRGLGRGRLADRHESIVDSPFRRGGRFYLAIVLDRSQADAAAGRAFWLRIAMTLVGCFFLAALAFAWLTTVRLTETRGRQRVLEAETRHLRDLGQAAAGLAHETRNPLGLIRGWTQRLAEQSLSTSGQQRQSQAIIEECDRVTARINQFLTFARPREPELERVDSDVLIGEVAELIEPDLEAKGLRVEHQAAAPPAVILADRDMLRQAVFNLLSNAIHFAPTGSPIELAVCRDQNGYCRIEVSDRGPGVPEEQADWLFTPYFTTRPSGTGLGLAIVRRIASAHGWKVGYSPRPGGGSMFWIGGIHAEHVSQHFDCR
jgi:signal transduction histidine kinase